MATTSRYMTPDQTAAFRVASEQAAAALHALYQARSALIPVLETPEGERAFNTLADAYDSLSGLPYSMAPQPEWQGGDVTRYRWPHGARV